MRCTAGRVKHLAVEEKKLAEAGRLLYKGSCAHLHFRFAYLCKGNTVCLKAGLCVPRRIYGALCGNAFHVQRTSKGNTIFGSQYTSGPGPGSEECHCVRGESGSEDCVLCESGQCVEGYPWENKPQDYPGAVERNFGGAGSLVCS